MSDHPTPPLDTDTMRSGGKPIANTVQVLLGELVFQFASKQQWVWLSPEIWQENKLRHEDALCIDAKGRICQNGGHFRRAEEDGSYPIRVYRKQFKTECGVSHA